MSFLFKAKNKDLVPSDTPRRSDKKRQWVAHFQTKGPKKLGLEQGHQDMLTQKVDTEKPNGPLLGLQEKVETTNKPTGFWPRDHSHGNTLDCC